MLALMPAARGSEVALDGGLVFVVATSPRAGEVSRFTSPLDALDAALTLAAGSCVALVPGLDDAKVEARACSLAAAGSEGQVLTTAAGQDLLADVAPAGVVFVDLGPHLLDAASDHPARVFQVERTDAVTMHPPLRTAGAVNPLPAMLTPFVGRQAELDTVSGLLRQHRLVTLAGSGGCGKTRLAVEAASRAPTDAVGRLWFADLAAVDEESEVRQYVASAVGARRTNEHDALAATIDVLRETRALLVLDNCEHMIGEVAALTETLLRSCPALTILATSREPLGVAGEVAWRVPSLDHDDAVRLFCNRAAAASAEGVRSDDAAAVDTIVRRVDGLPLALELAAARLATMTLAEIATSLDDAMRLLVGGARTRARQQTMEACIGWSYDRLSDVEQTAFRRLSVFVGGFDLTAAAAVVAMAPDELAEVIDSLVGKSLVQFTGGRRRVLEPLRQFGLARLAHGGELADCRDRHLAWCVELAQAASRELLSGRTDVWLPRMRAEEGNVRAAMAWSADGDRVAHATLAIVCAMTAGASGDLVEATIALEHVVASVGAAELHPQVLVGLGWLLMLQGRLDDADHLLTVARHADVDFPNSAWARSHAIYLLGRLRSWRGEFEESTELLEEVLGLDPSEVGDEAYFWAIAQSAENLFHVGRTRDARARVRSALETIDPDAAPYRACHLLNMLAAIEAALGHVEAALDLSDRCRDLAQSSGMTEYALLARTSHAVALFYAARYAEAGAELRRLAGDAVTAGLESAQLNANCALALVHLNAGDAAAALPFFEDALARIRTLELPLPNLGYTAETADAFLDVGDVARAGELLDDVAALVPRYPGSPAANTHRVVSARLLRRIGDPAAALPLLFDAVDAARVSGRVLTAAAALELLAGCVIDSGDLERGGALLGAGAAVRRASSLPRPTYLEAQWHADRARVASEPAAAVAFEDAEKLAIDAALALALRGRGRRRKTTVGWSSLTPTELEVVALAAQGLTNPQIAERLLIARGTVKTHLSRTFAKVGLSNRTELTAAWVERTGEP